MKRSVTAFLLTSLILLADSLAYLTDSRSSAGFSNMLVFYE